RFSVLPRERDRNPAPPLPRRHAAHAACRLHRRRPVFYEALGDSLEAYAERHFHLTQMVEGRTRLDRLESRLERAYRKGRMDVAEELEAALALPPFPAALSHVWACWWRLRRRKAIGQ